MPYNTIFVLVVKKGCGFLYPWLNIQRMTVVVLFCGRIALLQGKRWTFGRWDALYASWRREIYRFTTTSKKICTLFCFFMCSLCGLRAAKTELIGLEEAQGMQGNTQH